MLHLTERPYTQKVNYGEEPISNTIWGLNTSYKAESQFLTKIIDKIPLLDTKTPSAISFFGEFANLIPGHSKAISSREIPTSTILKQVKYLLILNHLMHGQCQVYRRDRICFSLKQG